MTLLLTACIAQGLHANLNNPAAAAPFCQKLRDLFGGDINGNGRGNPSTWDAHARCLVNGFRACADMNTDLQSDANIINRAKHEKSQTRFTALVNKQEKDTARDNRRGVKRSRRSCRDDEDSDDEDSDDEDC